jgi:actin-related protein
MLPAFLPKTTPKPDTATTTTTTATEAVPPAANGAPATAVAQQPTAVPVQDKHTPISLDVAIRQSIASIDKVELQKKMFSTIVLIGGSSLFDGINELIEDRYTHLYINKQN